ncbi:MAG: Cd(II)/Pb(II)-responsive transcriptional regulator [Desulfuromonadales bacterium]|nr:Cd(II)/Pb(II)-responsive transcriptional regulator [Desulfuromonadales bacterium]
MKIGELAQRSACSVETVRFYEREGLLQAPTRDTNGYRRYTDAHLVQLNFIRHCRSLGMGLPEVRTLRSLQAHPELACDEINTLIERQIDRVHQQVISLRMLEKQLHLLRDTCHARTNVGECGILRNLEQAAEGESCSCHPHGKTH